MAVFCFSVTVIACATDETKLKLSPSNVPGLSKYHDWSSLLKRHRECIRSPEEGSRRCFADVSNWPGLNYVCDTSYYG